MPALTPLTSIPVFFYNHRYLCKRSNSQNIFNKKCSRKIICSNINKFGIDYILDKNRDVHLESFIIKFDIYRSRPKRTILAASFFFGQLIGTLIYPYLISYFGIIDSLVINYILIFISYLIMAR